MRYAQEAAPRAFRFEADVSFEEGTHTFGFLLRASEADDTAYALNFEPYAHRIDFFMKPRLNYKRFNDEGLSRIFHMERRQILSRRPHGGGHDPGRIHRRQDRVFRPYVRT